VEVYAEPAQVRTLGHSTKARIISDLGDGTELGWFNGFARTKTGNYVASFFLTKKATVMPPHDIVITVRINLFKSDRTTRPGHIWTWSIQITDGPRRMIMEKPAYSNLYFEGPHDAAISVRDDLKAGGYTPTQPTRSSIVDAIAKEQVIVERVSAAEDRVFTVRQRPTRIVDT
jgi:hypothetical protein